MQPRKSARELLVILSKLHGFTLFLSLGEDRAPAPASAPGGDGDGDGDGDDIDADDDDDDDKGDNSWCVDKE